MKVRRLGASATLARCSLAAGISGAKSVDHYSQLPPCSMCKSSPVIPTRHPGCWFFAPSAVCAGDVFHLMHVIPEPQMVHIWAGIYVPPEENAELMEV